MKELLRRAYDALGRCEGLLAARAYRELHEPPYKAGPAHKEHDDVCALLADMQKKLGS